MKFRLELTISRLKRGLFILAIAAVTPHQKRTFGPGSKLGEGGIPGR